MFSFQKNYKRFSVEKLPVEKFRMFLVKAESSWTHSRMCHVEKETKRFWNKMLKQTQKQKQKQKQKRKLYIIHARQTRTSVDFE